jgi:hypothetical protein
MAAPAPAAAGGSISAASAADGVGQRGSYIYVSHADSGGHVGDDGASLSSLQGAPHNRRRTRQLPPPAPLLPRPRLFLLLPLLALLDVASCVLLAGAALRALEQQQGEGGGGGGGGAEDEESHAAAREKTRRLLEGVVGVAALRGAALVGMGVGRGVRQRAIAVAALCLVSSLL